MVLAEVDAKVKEFLGAECDGASPSETWPFYKFLKTRWTIRNVYIPCVSFVTIRGHRMGSTHPGTSFADLLQFS